MNWLAPCKLNLWLRVSEKDEAGMHPLESLATLVDWGDGLSIDLADEDGFVVDGPLSEGVPDDDNNLVWRALESARAETGFRERFSVALTKHVPAGAGLGGGSSDAAAMLAAFDELAGSSVASTLAPELGADVPLFLGSASQYMSGYGEVLEPARVVGDFAVAIVVPPFSLATPQVYSTWDQMGGPVDEPSSTKGLPPSLRSMDLFNDLYPAALTVCPELGDWRSELARRWSRPVFMSGSGSALFAYFADVEEAVAAAETASPDAAAKVGADLSKDGVHCRRD